MNRALDIIDNMEKIIIGKREVIENIVIVMLLKAIPDAIITAQSKIRIIVARDRCGINRFIISDAKSLPPVEASFLTTRPTPTPTKKPPTIVASIKKKEKTGK